jgi:DtxR family Mn-dependent transcriptional regulator
MVNYSSSEENYLKAIYHLQVEGGKATTNALAAALQSRPASITDMTKKLSAKGLLDYTPYYGFSLSSEGRKVALLIIRRHRLWEYFLADKLGFSWEEVHTVAEELEHVSSKKLIDKLDEYLGFPQFDPHGDPIPDKKGRLTSAEQLSLAKLPLNCPSKIIQVTNQSPIMLEELKQQQIAIGTQILVKRSSSFDGTLHVLIKNKPATISSQLAQHLFVKRL